jgi:hypothetical protein
MSELNIPLSDEERDDSYGLVTLLNETTNDGYLVAQWKVQLKGRIQNIKSVRDMINWDECSSDNWTDKLRMDRFYDKHDAEIGIIVADKLSSEDIGYFEDQYFWYIHAIIDWMEENWSDEKQSHYNIEVSKPNILKYYPIFKTAGEFGLPYK